MPVTTIFLIAALGCACTAKPPAPGDTASSKGPNGQGADSTDGQEAELAPLDDGGYSVTGTHGLQARLTFDESGTWTLEGSFTFPTAGFTVGEPRIVMLKRMPPHVNITIPVTPPAEDAVVAQVLTEEPVEIDVQVPSGSTFSVFVETERPNDER